MVDSYTATSYTTTSYTVGGGGTKTVLADAALDTFERNIAGGPNPNIAFAKSSTKQGVSSWVVEGNRTTTDTWRWQMTDACILRQSGSSGAQGARADYVGTVTNGFRINWSDATAAAHLIPYIALKGGQYDVVEFAITSGTGNQDVTTAFDPVGGMLVSNQSASSNPVAEEAHAAFCIGAWDGTNEGSSTIVDEDNIADSENARSHSATKGILFLSTAVNATGSSTTTDLDGDVSNGTAKFTINKTTNTDAQLGRVIAIVFGNAAVAPAEDAVRAEIIGPVLV